MSRKNCPYECQQMRPATDGRMDVLIIIPYEGYFSDFSSYLVRVLNSKRDEPKVRVTKVITPYYFKTSKILGKRQIFGVMVFNFFYYFCHFVIAKKRDYDIIVLANHTVTIPFLLMVRVLPFVKARKRIIVTSFFLHGMAKKKVVQRALHFLFSNDKLVLQVQSPDEVEYYSKLIDEAKIVHIPFCQGEVSNYGNCGEAQEYIFAGGYTNRDYNCLLEAARRIDHKFIVISSKLNQMSRVKQTPSNVKILTDTNPKDFHGYLKNSKIVVIPLNEEIGSSGQMVALAAMFFKKPIIYTNINSVSQYFEDGVSGTSYEKGDAEDLASKITYLLSEPDFCEKLGINAFRRYYENYHVANYCEFLADLILR